MATRASTHELPQHVSVVRLVVRALCSRSRAAAEHRIEEARFGLGERGELLPPRRFGLRGACTRAVDRFSSARRGLAATRRRGSIRLRGGRGLGG